MATERLLSSWGAPKHAGVADIDDGDVTLRPMDPPGRRVEEYDYARGSHLYEDLPLPKKYDATSVESVNTDRQGPSPHQESSWPSTISTSTTQLSNNNNTDSTRKRHNPLYDAVQKQYPGPPAPDDNVVLPSHKASGHRLACVWGCALVATIIALVSLCVALYVLISIPPAQLAETNKNLEVKYEQLKSQYEELHRKYSQLADMLAYTPGEANETSVPLVVRVVKNKMSIQDLSSNFTEQQEEISNLNQQQVTAADEIGQKLSEQSHRISLNTGQISVAAANVSSVTQKLEGLAEFVSNVSKMEGPQGAQGVGNLSACYYTTRQLKLVNAVPTASRTGWEPSNQILMDNVVMAATCSVSGGTLANLESATVTIFPNTWRFRCTCSGVDSTGVLKDRICYLHLWLCPRLS